MPPYTLCQHEEKLEKSHIIPEFLYKELYDHKYRLHEKRRKGNVKPQLSAHESWVRVITWKNAASVL